jgi:hypothetical protein
MVLAPPPPRPVIPPPSPIPVAVTPRNDVTVVWTPLPGSQALVMTCPCDHILYEGSRGPGKTDAQLMFFRKFVGLGYGAHWRGIIFDRQYNNLDDLINKSLRWYSAFRDGARFLRSRADYKWMWPTGEELFFRQIMRKEDYWNFHGQEFSFIGWNELCKYPNSELYDMMMSCNRTSFMPSEHSPDVNNPLPKIPLTVFSTTNPYGPGHAWVKKRFIDPASAGVPQVSTIEIFNPQTQSRVNVTKTQVRIFGSYKENRYLTPEYIAELEKERDKNRRKAWLEGDWNIVAGGAFDDLWDENVHVIPRFPIPINWICDRSHDWGSSKPFSCGWWALANGEEVRIPDGRTFMPKRGSLIRFAEWYGHNPNETNVGLMMSAKAVGEGVRTIEQGLLAGQWIQRSVSPGPADNSIFNTSRGDDLELDSIALSMQKVGISWETSNKAPGSRKMGFQLMRDRLENALLGEGAAIYFMVNCRQAISQIPTLPRDPDDLDDVDSEAEDHVWDETRYRVLKGAIHAATNIPGRHAT